ncbi:anti-sigma factor [Idiomarina xiamenensis]|uniref:Uncharacterized protein n=1 Tax=Idiomarina xiamenensis 10-D-4 TaxID=740709 RepID=K2JJS0_9GAMM|nr:anti-sigma factor [Idiomarina xiamenensis]EKE83656.1 hypothetical protein A10D4_07405 [Idiomarina xiamenensis 10-D-4]
MKQSNRPTVEQLLQQHQQPLEPKRDLWPGIERTLSQQRRQPRSGSSWRASWPMLLASAAMLMLTVVIWQKADWQNATQPAQQQASASWQLVQLMNQQHQQQTELLQTKFMQAGYQTLNSGASNDLQTLRQASRSITEALANEPANPELIRLLQWVHQQEIALMDTAYEQQTPWRQL